MTPAELCRRTRLPKATMYRILSVLEVHGMVNRVAHGVRLGDRLTAWAARSDVGAVLRDLVSPALLTLHQQVDAAVGVATVNDDRVTYALRLFTDGQRASIAPLDECSPVHATASGKVLAAFDPDLEGRIRATGVLSAYTGRTVTDLSHWGSELGRVRQARLAAVNGEYREGLTALAVPVWGDNRRVIAAVAAAGPDVAGRARYLRGPLWACAAEITRYLTMAARGPAIDRTSLRVNDV